MASVLIENACGTMPHRKLGGEKPMPGPSAQGLAHLPADRFPTDHIPATVLENLPFFDFVGQAAPQASDAPGLANFPIDRFPVEHFPEVAMDHVPFADLFGF
jgi:hypothetical protein